MHYIKNLKSSSYPNIKDGYYSFKEISLIFIDNNWKCIVNGCSRKFDFKERPDGKEIINHIRYHHRIFDVSKNHEEIDNRDYNRSNERRCLIQIPTSIGIADSQIKSSHFIEPINSFSSRSDSMSNQMLNPIENPQFLNRISPPSYKSFYLDTKMPIMPGISFLNNQMASPTKRDLNVPKAITNPSQSCNTKCGICKMHVSSASQSDFDPLIKCNNLKFKSLCSVVVHRSCYGVTPNQLSFYGWSCDRCLHSTYFDVFCELCPNKGGIFKRTTDSRFVHVICSLSIVSHFQSMKPEINQIAIKNAINQSVDEKCCVCDNSGKTIKMTIGALIQCSNCNCDKWFHATCADYIDLLDRKFINGSIRFSINCRDHSNLKKESHRRNNRKRESDFHSDSPTVKIYSKSRQSDCAKAIETEKSTDLKTNNSSQNHLSSRSVFIDYLNPKGTQSKEESLHIEKKSKEKLSIIESAPDSTSELNSSNINKSKLMSFVSFDEKRHEKTKDYKFYSSDTDKRRKRSAKNRKEDGSSFYNSHPSKPSISRRKHSSQKKSVNKSKMISKFNRKFNGSNSDSSSDSSFETCSNLEKLKSNETNQNQIGVESKKNDIETNKSVDKSNDNELSELEEPVDIICDLFNFDAVNGEESSECSKNKSEKINNNQLVDDKNNRLNDFPNKKTKSNGNLKDELNESNRIPWTDHSIDLEKNQIPKPNNNSEQQRQNDEKEPMVNVLSINDNLMNKSNDQQIFEIPLLNLKFENEYRKFIDKSSEDKNEFKESSKLVDDILDKKTLNDHQVLNEPLNLKFASLYENYSKTNDNVSS